ncbi:MAG: hypothetical protein ACOYBY_00380 [Dermatophilaceae bacterium]
MSDTGPACATCGRQPAPQEPSDLTWTRGQEGGRTVWTCPECSRRHLRAIEGKLDSQWW